ncbi:MAG: DUF4252 domain-containing protein [Gammaproteobacteria bacterium]|jgi:hypothetical protein|nr:DUF4252 domain-containing protein [Gammaproteobacteria bacterium]MDP6536505.1 DUF4252 domain-containing protein [Gammaproteobacteria bacterium]MDP6732799.1 DUF4252 domain-containing protein [Gammaproteobacteria bacterium]|tara:strand:+ start:677 stop:1231 length:555 start_codon:yes stop_codon:yes gene_type:complete
MKILGRLLLPLVCIGMIPIAMAADNGVADHPGYVDYSVLTSITNIEPTVEVSLKAPILNMITNLIRSEDEEAANFVSKLLLFTVNVFESDAIDVDEIAGSMNEIADDLDQRGWERVVRVREDPDHVDVYFRLSDDADVMYGIAVMVAAPGETVLVNIVGDISTNDISALGQRFDIDELVDLEVN